MAFDEWARSRLGELLRFATALSSGWNIRRRTCAG